MNPFVQAILDLLAEVWNWSLDIWDTGNHWARWAIGIIVPWPILVVFAALLPTAVAYVVVPIVALLPILAIVFLLIAALDPLVLAVLAAFRSGRRILRTAGAVIGAELVFGLYLALLPVGNRRGLVPILFLAAVALPFLSLITGGWGKWLRRFAVLVLLFVTLLFFVPTIAPALAGRWWTQEARVGQDIRTNGVGAILPDVSVAASTGRYPFCDDTEAGLNVTLATREHTLQLHPDCWSGWVSMPTAPYTFRIKHGKPMEMRFWNGRRLMVQPQDKIWVGDIGSDNFRLRGEEVVTIVVEPR